MKSLSFPDVVWTKIYKRIMDAERGFWVFTQKSAPRAIT